MLEEILIRFVIGGVIVSAFAVIGELVEPKTFSGLFGAAPSVGIATLALSFRKGDSEAVAIEARWMLVATVAFVAYSTICVDVCRRRSVPVSLGAAAAWMGWLVVALGLWCALRGALRT